MNGQPIVGTPQTQQAIDVDVDAIEIKTTAGIVLEIVLKRCPAARRKPIIEKLRSRLEISRQIIFQTDIAAALGQIRNGDFRLIFSFWAKIEKMALANGRAGPEAPRLQTGLLLSFSSFSKPSFSVTFLCVETVISGRHFDFGPNSKR